jgi:asparaginyl-tRNA synthetase
VQCVGVTSEHGEFPIGKKEHGVEFLMKNRHLWIRGKRQSAILRVRNEVEKAWADFFYERGFYRVDTPIFTPNACEGTTTLFEVDYHGDTVYLSQSGQLYNEADIGALGQVYCFGPTFRAEKSKTRRHLTEFWMLEPEVAFLDLDGDMDLEENVVSYMVERVLTKCHEELKALERDITKLECVKKPFPRITYTQAVELLQKTGKDFKWGDDFGADDETAIGTAHDRPVLVHRYPAAIKAFYMKHDPLDDRLALGVDMIAPEGYGEITGGGQREDDLATLEKRIAECKLPREAYEWYLDVRRYGSVPHAGFGLGLERCVAWICGIHHLRETIPFPRMLEKVYP